MNRWKVGDVLVAASRANEINPTTGAPYEPVYRKITEARKGPAYSWRYCEADGTTYGAEFISENSNDQALAWGWQLATPPARAP